MSRRLTCAEGISFAAWRVHFEDGSYGIECLLCGHVEACSRLILVLVSAYQVGSVIRTVG